MTKSKKKSAKTAAPATPKAAEVPYKQQVHRKCGGAIVLVAKDREPHIACTKCKAAWELALNLRCKPIVPEDWEDGI